MHSHVTCMMWSRSCCRSKFCSAGVHRVDSATVGEPHLDIGSSLRMPEKMAVSMAFTSPSLR